jgi:plasmid stabilization system protein ParE
MKAVYHRYAAKDVRGILDYHEAEAGGRLADRFFDDLLATVAKAAENPRHFPPLEGAVRRGGAIRSAMMRWGGMLPRR